MKMPPLRLMVLGLAALSIAAAFRPAPSLLGIELGMSDTVVRQRLKKLGEPDMGADALKQSWKIKHRSYGFVAVRYGPDWRLRWISAFARPNGKRIRYSDIGPLAAAKRHGFYIYIWDVQRPRGASYRVTARGTDSLYVSSVSLSPYQAPRGPSSAPPDSLD